MPLDDCRRLAAAEAQAAALEACAASVARPVTPMTGAPVPPAGSLEQEPEREGNPGAMDVPDEARVTRTAGEPPTVRPAEAYAVSASGAIAEEDRVPP